MPNLTIENFWKRRLSVDRVQSSQLIRGWAIEGDGFKAFKEAPLTLSAELSEGTDPETSPLLLVSAPGAVGKSTLARQIAFVSGAVYLDLAKADPVGANTLSGGLVRSGLYEIWQKQKTTVLIDGIDEARLRVTQEAFEAFLADIAEIAKGRTVPTILFGRTGAILDAWLVLSGGAVEVPVLEIGFYDAATALDFAAASLSATRSDGSISAVERTALDLLLKRLRAETTSDGDRFAGYAPVLQAVAQRVASASNIGALIAQIEKGEQPVTLQNVAVAILDRERSKLAPLTFENPALKDALYLPEEQLIRLIARVYRLPPPNLLAMGANDAQTYSRALDTWVADHPFLDGGTEASSAVFDAMICTRALRNAGSAEAAMQRELRRGAAANPFLSEFYVSQGTSVEPFFLPPEHIGIVYASLRARLSIGDLANLVVEGAEDGEDEEALRAEVEITLARRSADRPRVLRFDTEQTGTFRLGAYIEDVDITVPHMRVEIGPGPEAVLVAPISIQCQELEIATEKVFADSPPGRKDAAVFLEANNFIGTKVTSVPVLRGSVSFAASWPGVRSHPWTSVAMEPTPIEDPRVDEALRRFRKFVFAFRSHSKGNLARFKDKIEHARMTKGTGRAVLNLMVGEHILTLTGEMYILDADRLGAQTGATYADCVARRFNPKTIEFINRALQLHS